MPYGSPHACDVQHCRCSNPFPRVDATLEENARLLCHISTWAGDLQDLSQHIFWWSPLVTPGVMWMWCRCHLLNLWFIDEFIHTVVTISCWPCWHSPGHILFQDSGAKCNKSDQIWSQIYVNRCCLVTFSGLPCQDRPISRRVTRFGCCCARRSIYPCHLPCICGEIFGLQALKYLKRALS